MVKFYFLFIGLHQNGQVTHGIYTSIPGVPVYIIQSLLLVSLVASLPQNTLIFCQTVYLNDGRTCLVC